MNKERIVNATETAVIFEKKRAMKDRDFQKSKLYFDRLFKKYKIAQISTKSIDLYNKLINERI